MRYMICEIYEPAISRNKVNDFILGSMNPYEMQGQKDIVKVARHLTKCRSCAEHVFYFYSLRQELQRSIDEEKYNYVLSRTSKDTSSLDSAVEVASYIIDSNESSLKRRSKTSFLYDITEAIFSLHGLEMKKWLI